LGQTIVLSLWLGAALFVVAVVAPAAFAVLPTRSLAGAMVGHILPALFYAGMLVGMITILSEWWVARRLSVTGRTVAGLVTVVSCGIAQLAIAPRIARLRAEIEGALDSLPTDDARRVAFGRLHGMSVLWLAVAALAATFALVLAVRAQRREA
jgi:hypothetical protein